MILLISSGGNLNILNEFGQTPVAFGSETLLTLLDIKEAIATFNKFEAKKKLPPAYDNNSFFKRKQKADKEKGGLYFDFEAMKTASDTVVQDNGNIKNFMHPGERVQID